MFVFKKFGVCNLSIVPIRDSATDTSEIITQLLFGDTVEILEEGQPWVKIRFANDAYEGWMDFKQLTYIDEAEYLELELKEKVYLKSPLLTVTGPRGLQRIMLASTLPNLTNKTIQFGGETYHFGADIEDIKPSLIETAMEYINTPYLWGGKSLFGIDCSGLVQNCFKIHAIELPRDASKQVDEGELISYANRKIGDVPFFINAKGIVHHVGILTEKDKIIHAAGSVRIDIFNEKGIFRDDLNKYTHHYHSIKRYL